MNPVVGYGALNIGETQVVITDNVDDGRRSFRVTWREWFWRYACWSSAACLDMVVAAGREPAREFAWWVPPAAYLMEAFPGRVVVVTSARGYAMLRQEEQKRRAQDGS